MTRAKGTMLVLGKGFMGQKIADFFGCDISPDRILSLADAQAVIGRYKPSVLINCIGYTGASNVDDCEIDKDKTLFQTHLCLSSLPRHALEIKFGSSISQAAVSSNSITQGKNRLPRILCLIFLTSIILAPRYMLSGRWRLWQRNTAYSYFAYAYL